MNIRIIALFTLLFTATAWGWTLERVRLTSAGADQISGVQHEVNFSVVNSGNSVVEGVFIDIREVYRTPNCGVANWRKKGCSKSIFNKTERIHPKRGKDYSVNWIVNQYLESSMVFRFVDTVRRKDKVQIVKVFDKNRCRPFSRELQSGLGMTRSQFYVGENTQSTTYDRAFLNVYDRITVPKKQFQIDYFHKGRNSKWIPMENLAGMRAIVPNSPNGDLLYTLSANNPLTIFRYNEMFAIEYDIYTGFDRQKIVIKNHRGVALYYEIICRL